MLLTQRALSLAVCLVASVEVQRSCWGFHMGLNFLTAETSGSSPNQVLGHPGAVIPQGTARF